MSKPGANRCMPEMLGEIAIQARRWHDLAQSGTFCHP
jgi:hypothetical protein